MRRWKKMLLFALLGLVVLFAAGVSYVRFAPQFGARPEGARLERMERSPHYAAGRFQNLEHTTMSGPDRSAFGATIEYFKGGTDRVPEQPLPTVRVDPGVIGSAPGGDLHVTWLGHSTALIEIDGKVLLTDPVFEGQPSPVSFFGPTVFIDPLPLERADLPPVDVVVITHDHYDHLDHTTIVELARKVPRFFVPLGVGAHLERWGVPADAIVELDWWKEAQLGPLALTATPTRHFSGRGVIDRDRTLWAAWVIRGTTRKIYFGGDSGYGDHFKEVGARLGPFDVTMLESGAYDLAWPYIHMMPEETVQAHKDLGGGVLLPIHWAKYELALHPWYEPIDRLTAAAETSGVAVATPRPGERFALDGAIPRTAWWQRERERDPDRAVGALPAAGSPPG